MIVQKTITPVKLTSLTERSATPGVYYRLVALWIFCEAMIGGVIHGLRLPVSGLVVGSSAVVCISLIAWYHPARGAILRATIIVAVFKLILSPQASFPAYIAVFFQGALGELLFRGRRHFFISAMILSVLALLESGLQRILVLTIVYGNDLWTVINEFLNRLSGKQGFTNYSLWIGGSYVAVHALTGIMVGWFAGNLPGKIDQMQADEKYSIELTDRSVNFPKRRKRKNVLLKVLWIMILLLFLQTELGIGEPILPSNLAVRVLVRSLLIILGWIIVVAPLLDWILKRWLRKKQTQLQTEVNAIRKAMPEIHAISNASWKKSNKKKGLRRIPFFARLLIVNVVHSAPRLYILSGPIHSGKTTSLMEWIKKNPSRGILTPVTCSGREFFDIHRNERFLMEAGEGDTEIIQIGKYSFRQEGFDKAEKVIRKGFQGNDWLIIDEIGPLELKGQGFANVLKDALKLPGKNLLLVVREGLVEDVVKKFGIMSYETVIKPPALNNS